MNDDYTFEQVKVTAARLFFDHKHINGILKGKGYVKQYYWRVRKDGRVVNTFLKLKNARAWVRKQRELQRD